MGMSTEKYCAKCKLDVSNLQCRDTAQSLRSCCFQEAAPSNAAAPLPRLYTALTIMQVSSIAEDV